MSGEPGVRAPRDLRAVCVPLDDGPPIDPFSLAGPDGIVIANQELTLVGIGAALSIPFRRPPGRPGGGRSAASTGGYRYRRSGEPTGFGPGQRWGDSPSTGVRPARLLFPNFCTGGRTTERSG